MKQTRTYSEATDIKNTEKLRKMIGELPDICHAFFRAIEPTTSPRTRVAYAYDLRIFFDFLKKSNPALKTVEIKNIDFSLIDQLKKQDIEEYLEYIAHYEKDEFERVNGERGRERKLSSLRKLFHYFYTSEMIKKDVSALVAFPKKHEKNIIRLDAGEVSVLLDNVEKGEGGSKHQEMYADITRIRDLALLTLLLGTGIRVSEFVGIDLDDLDFRDNAVRIKRKGGSESIIYFGEEVCAALQNYLKQRQQMIPVNGHENALFLSIQKKRISVRAVENLVKKHAKTAAPLKTITPHKLRSTYGTRLYQETGDIYLVADVLGHKDVNTTRKHYAALDEERRRKAADAVKLRES